MYNIDYSHNVNMKWLTPRLQNLLYAASITKHISIRQYIWNEITREIKQEK